VAREDEGPVGLDPATLPPAIGAEGESAAEEAKPRRRTRRSRPEAGDETLETVN
jgi:hypothetical protein